MSTDLRATESALCRREDPELWFPQSKGRRSKKPHPAVVICHRCPIQQACLQHALDADERHGIWGGLTEAERRALIRPRKPRAPDQPAARTSEVRGVS
jgi:WhiB family transcriptional regulator, redox-sensing transcriptional regulator